jgi:hypothetical protein
MPRSQDPIPAKDHQELTEDEFEDFVAAAPKVDPKGLSGKHRKVQKNDKDDGQPNRPL